MGSTGPAFRPVSTAKMSVRRYILPAPRFAGSESAAADESRDLYLPPHQSPHAALQQNRAIVMTPGAKVWLVSKLTPEQEPQGAGNNLRVGDYST